MIRLPLAVSLFALLVSFPALGEPVPQADLGVQFTIVDRLTAGDPIVAYGYLRNHGPDAADDVVLTTTAGRFVQAHGCIADDAGRCTVRQLPAGGEVFMIVRLDREPVAGRVPIEVKVTSATRDPNPVNDRAAGTVDFVLAPELRFSLYGGIADPGGPVEYETIIANDSVIAATNARFTLPLPEGWTFERSLSDHLQCSVAGRDVHCTIARIEPRSEVRSRFVVRAAATPNGVPYQSTPVKLTTDHGVLPRDGDEYRSIGHFAITVYRHLPVTHAGDDGEGSLRGAITEANGACVAGITTAPCKIVFDIPGGSSHQTIQPRTPLPAITASLHIDGSTQTARHGDTNPAGPEIEINGSLLESGDGLDITATDSFFSLRDVVINGFPGNGVVIRSKGYSRLIERTYIGTDVTGQRAVPNGGRGIAVDVNQAFGSAHLSIRENVISGNARSGVFVANGFGVSVTANRIGASAGDRPAPLGNGASGLYFGPGASAVVVQKNVIAFNAESGIATSRPTGYISIRGNSITGNGLLGIDHGLDLVTPNPAPDKFSDVPPFPILTSARYDAATNVTRIDGRMEQRWLYSIADVELFANTSPGNEGHGQGELFVGRVSLRGPNFTFDYPGDLRGRFIAATFTRPNSYYPEAPYLQTSEFSASLKVEGDAAAPIDPAAIVPRGADVWVRLPYLPSRLQAGILTRAYTTVENLGPEPTGSVIVELSIDHGRLLPGTGGCEPAGTGLRCVLPDLFSVHFDIEVPTGPKKVTIRARVTPAAFDPDPSNNEAVAEIELTSHSVFDLRIDSPGATDPGGTASYSVHVRHHTAVAARNVEVRVGVPRGWSLVSGPANGWTCSHEGPELVCRIAEFAGLSSQSFSYVLRAPADESGVRAQAERARITAATELPHEPTAFAAYEVFRIVRVTTTADEGTGSLRDAITRANSECKRDSFHSANPFNCKVVFAVDAPSIRDGVVSIRPLRPLPSIEATDITIDARTQTTHTGDTNPLGPEVELNGSMVSTGNGLEIVSSGTCVVRGLVINGFPDNGIFMRMPFPYAYGDLRLITENYIGTDPTGRVAVPNRGRGLTVDTAAGEWMRLTVMANVISGNARAGVFIASGSAVRIADNRIGLSAGDEPAPLSNGASGIYLGPTEGIAVEGNEIAHNLHAGIAVHRDAKWNTIRGNATFDNGGLGVDHGLDMVTFNDDSGRPEELPRFPVILSAVWDESAKVTRITGRAERSRIGRGVVVELFANTAADGSGYGEAQRSLGEVALPVSKSEQSFAFETAEDLRGLFVTATLSRRGDDTLRENWTSEISQAVPVQ